MNSSSLQFPEKLNKGNITSDKNGGLEFALTIKKEEMEKFFNAYLHEIDPKNKNKDLLLVSSNEKTATLLQEVKDILLHLNQSVTITEPSTWPMALQLVKNTTFRELLYLFLDEKTQTFKLLLTKNKRKLDGQSLFEIMQNTNLFYSKSFNVSACNYTKNDPGYKKEIVAIINSIYLALKKDETDARQEPFKTIFFKTENAFIKNEPLQLLPPFGLKISNTPTTANFIFEVDALGEKIENIKWQEQILDKELYLKYLHQKRIRKKLKIYVKAQNLYFLSSNLPIIARFGRKISDVLCEAYLFAMISKTKDFLEYASKNNFLAS